MNRRTIYTLLALAGMVAGAAIVAPAYAKKSPVTGQDDLELIQTLQAMGAEKLAVLEERRVKQLQAIARVTSQRDAFGAQLRGLIVKLRPDLDSGPGALPAQLTDVALSYDSDGDGVKDSAVPVAVAWNEDAPAARAEKD